MQRKATRWRFRLAALGISTLVGVLLAEGLTRWAEATLLSARFPEPGSKAVVNLAGLNYNDTYVTPRKPAGEFRILSFGDSYCYSIMRPEHSYSGRIAHYVSENLDGRKVRVVNLGEPCTSLNDYIQAYEYWSKVLEHDGAVFNIYLGNDLLDVVNGGTPATWQPNRLFMAETRNIADGSPRVIPRKFPLRVMDFAYAAYLTHTGALRDSGLPGSEFNVAACCNLAENTYREVAAIEMHNFDPGQLERMAPGYRQVARLLTLASTLRKQGKHVLVAISPNDAQVNPDFRRALAESQRLDLSAYDMRLPADIITAIHTRVDPEVPLADLVEYFQCEAKRTGIRFYYSTNMHWGKEGNELAGKILASAILTRWFSRPEILPESLQQQRLQQRRAQIAPAGLARARDYVGRLILPQVAENAGEVRAVAGHQPAP